MGEIGGYIALVIGGAYLIVSLFQFGAVFVRGSPPRPVLSALRLVQPYHIINHYGLFAVMTKTRPEIIIEGSRDGKNWHPYTFRYKPGPLDRAPGWAQPHQPRLDWQMWFAALGNYKQNPWVLNLMQKMLEGSSSVLKLFKDNPFPDRPPRFIRAELYDYTFTDFESIRKDGNWWKKEYRGVYIPPVSLQQQN